MDNKKLTQDMSKVEVKGFEAKHYDFVMNLITFGTYSRFIKNAIKDLNVFNGAMVADFGSGTGKNDKLILKYSGDNTKILGFDIGNEMISKFRKQCNSKNFSILKTLIDNDFKNIDFKKVPMYVYKESEKNLSKIDLEEILSRGKNNYFEEIDDYYIEKSRNLYFFKNIFNEEKNIDLFNKFDFVFISFVLHGFIQEKRETIIKNAYNLLKPGGKFAILDYNEFEVDNASFIPRYAITKIECPLAADFVKRDWKKILSNFIFKDFKENFYYRKYVRLLVATKK